MTVKIGSLFAGIGGFELGLERSWGNAETIWQVEREKFCQKILQKHWPKSTIYNDVRDITKDNVEPVDVLIGGFPCQDISTAGKQRGVNNGEKSSLWWEMWRIASDLRPRIIIMENVANIIRLGGVDVIGSLAQIGYDCEWTIVSARQFGAPHLRERWFCVAYSQSDGRVSFRRSKKESHEKRKTRINPTIIGDEYVGESQSRSNPTSHTQRLESQTQSIDAGPSQWKTSNMSQLGTRSDVFTTDQSKTRGGYWHTTPYPSPFCRVDDGIPNRVARLKALGNAIVPQCSQWVGDQVLKSGLLDDLLEDK
jgi:DNA (cytosine-5)-methyltransferase 1